MTALDALRAAQERTRARLLDPKAIQARQEAGRRESEASAHDWRRSGFGRRTEGAPRPLFNRDDEPREARRRRERR